jgi:hypothetical protein
VDLEDLVVEDTEVVLVDLEDLVVEDTEEMEVDTDLKEELLLKEEVDTEVVLVDLEDLVVEGTEEMEVDTDLKEELLLKEEVDTEVDLEDLVVEGTMVEVIAPRIHDHHESLEDIEIIEQVLKGNKKEVI